MCKPPCVAQTLGPRPAEGDGSSESRTSASQHMSGCTLSQLLPQGVPFRCSLAQRPTGEEPPPLSQGQTLELPPSAHWVSHSLAQGPLVPFPRVSALAGYGTPWGKLRRRVCAGKGPRVSPLVVDSTTHRLAPSPSLLQALLLAVSCGASNASLTDLLVAQSAPHGIHLKHWVLST